MVCIYLVLSFGFKGAPGEWMAWATAVKQDFEAQRPARADYEGPDPFAVEILMDYSVLVEPVLGRRPWLASAALEDSVQVALGDQAINRQKDEVEGAFSTCRCCWGLEFDTDRGTVRMPEARIQKGAYLLSLPCYDPGSRSCTLLDLQRLRGTAQAWACVLPSLRLELRSIDVFLSGTKIPGPIRCPEDVDEARAYVDLWETFENLRWLCARRLKNLIELCEWSKISPLMSYVFLSSVRSHLRSDGTPPTSRSST